MRTIFWINLSWSLLIVNAVMVPMFLHYGLSFQQIALVTATLHLTMIASDLPFGILADRLGVKRSLGIATFLKGLAGTIPLLYPSFSGFVATFFLLGLANGMYSGTDLKKLAGQALKDNSCNYQRRALYIQVGLALGGLIGGLLSAAEGGFLLPLMLNFITGWIPFALVLRLKDDFSPKRLKSAHHVSLLEKCKCFKGIWEKSQEFQRTFKVRVATMVTLGVIAAFVQALWHELELPLKLYGWVWFAQALFGILILKNIKLFQSKMKSYKEFCVIIAPAICLIGFLVFPVLGFVVVPTILLLEFTKTAANSILVKDYNEQLPMDAVVTLNSLVTTLVSIILAVLLPLVGAAIDHWGLHTSFVIVSAIYGASLFVMGVGLVSLRKLVEGLVKDVLLPVLSKVRV